MNQLPDQARTKTPGERPAELLFIGYTLATLVDLTVINLFDEYWAYVLIDSFTISLFTAITMQVLLKLTLAGEHALAAYFAKKSGVTPKILRGVTTYIILVGSKFVILGIINVIFGEKVLFTGPWNGVVAFIVLVIAILAAEFLVSRIYRALKKRSASMSI